MLGNVTFLEMKLLVVSGIVFTDLVSKGLLERQTSFLCGMFHVNNHNSCKGLKKNSFCSKKISAFSNQKYRTRT